MTWQQLLTVWWVYLSSHSYIIDISIQYRCIRIRIAIMIKAAVNQGEKISIYQYNIDVSEQG